MKKRKPALRDKPPTLPRTEWRTAADGGWNLWDFFGAEGPSKRWRYAGRLSADEWDTIKQNAEVKSDDQSSVSGDHLDDPSVVGGQDDFVTPGPGESLVTQGQIPPAVTSDSGKKKPARKARRVTSDSHGVNSQKTTVLPFRQKAVSHTKQKEKEKWEIKECGCRLPKFPKWEWRDFENGHRLLMVIGYGKSKNNKRVKKRDCVRYYTHAAMKDFWENEYGEQINGSAKA